MFKPVGVTESLHHQQNSSVEECFTENQNASQVDDLHSEQCAGCGCREELAKIQADFHLFRESMMKNISKLNDRATKYEKSLDIQDRQIADLLKLNEAQTVEIKKLKRVSVLKPSLNILGENAVSLLDVPSPEDCEVEINEVYEHEIVDKSPNGTKESAHFGRPQHQCQNVQKPRKCSKRLRSRRLRK